MRWLRTLLVSALAIVGGVIGNLLATAMEGTWGQPFALWRIVGSVSGAGLVLGLDACMGYIFNRSLAVQNRTELLRQVQSHRRELRRFQRSDQIGLPWTPARTAQMHVHKQKLEQIKNRLGRGRTGVPYDEIDDYFVPRLPLSQRVKIFLGKPSHVLYAFPLLVILALCLSPLSERFYLAYVATSTPSLRTAVALAPTSRPTSTGTPTLESQAPTLTFTWTATALPPSPTPTRTSVAPTQTSVAPTQTPDATPTSTPMPTQAPEATPTSTPTPTPSPTPTRTPEPTSTSTSTPTATPTLAATPTPTAAPTRAPTQTPEQTSEPASPEASTQVPDAAPSTATAPASLPAPVLIEPESDAAFTDRVRFKFSWVRELADNERFSIHLESVDDPATFEWRPNAQDIVAGGGNIAQDTDGYRFEVNGGIGALSQGKAFWKVAVFSDDAGTVSQITPWSEERPILRK